MARTPTPTQAKQVYTLSNQLQTQLRALEKSQPPVKLHITQATASASDTSGDIEALAFLVLMQASKSVQEDLEAIMEQVKAINCAKAGVRRQAKPTLDFEATFQLLGTLYAQQLDAELDQIKNDIASMSEMSEMESLRLQMAMDRMSRMMSTLSNILKKISDTSSQIVQNLK